MSLRALRTLRAIALHGTFARAGEVIGLSQSAVSLQIKSLEEELGVRLFDRSSQRPVLTDAGRIVLERAIEVVDLYDRLPEALGGAASLTGRLRIGAMESVLTGIFPDAVAALRRTHPGIRVSAVAGRSSDLSHQVVSGELHGALTTAPVKPYSPDLVWRHLYHDRFWLLCPPGHAGHGLASLLTTLPFIRLDTRTWAGRMIDRELRRQGIRVRDDLVLDRPDVAMQLVERGLGVSVLPLLRPPSPDRSGSGAGGITVLPFGTPQMRRPVALIERRDQRGGRMTQVFGQVVADLAGGLAGNPDAG